MIAGSKAQQLRVVSRLLGKLLRFKDLINCVSEILTDSKEKFIAA